MGGLFGLATGGFYTSSLILNNTYSKVSIYSSTAYCGGLIGQITLSNSYLVKIINSYTNSIIVGTKTGNFIGYNTPCSGSVNFTNCYYNNENISSIFYNNGGCTVYGSPFGSSCMNLFSNFSKFDSNLWCNGNLKSGNPHFFVFFCKIF